MSNKFDFETLFKLIDIVTVVTSKINLKKKGSNYWGICPFHKDTSPSLSVSSQKNIFKCFSCGASGNAVGFLQRFENITFMEALKEALTLSNADNNIIDSLNQRLKLSNNEKIYLINKQAANLMNNYLLMNLKNENINKFIQKRQLTNKAINRFNLGYIDETFFENFYDNLFEFCKQNFNDEIPDDILRKTNLFFYDESKKTNRLFFNYRIIFPILDKFANVIGFSGRDITELSNAKYLNSGESTFFSKGNNLYNYYSINNLDTNDYLIIVEGYMDCISLVNNGFLCTIATMGTSLTQNQLKLIFDLKHLKKIILSFDNDQAGKDAFIKNLTNTLEFQKKQDKFIPVYISGLYKTIFKDTDELFKDSKNTNNKQVFSEYENALFIASVFILNTDKNIEFNLNEAIKFILQYSQYNFSIYVDNALELFKKYLIDNQITNQNQIEKIINNLSKIDYNSKKNSKKYERINKFELHNPVLIKMRRLISLLMNNYCQLLFIFLYFPKEAINFVKKYNDDMHPIDLLGSDKNFLTINNKLIKNGLFNVIKTDSIEYSYFINYSYLIFVYIDFFNENELIEHDINNNFNYLLKKSDFFSSLKNDYNFLEGVGIYNYLTTNFGNDLHNNKFEMLKKNDENKLYKNLDLIFINIWKILLELLNMLKKQ